MNTIAAIQRRRSVRKYTSTPIPHSVIEEIIHAGMQAPSAKNRQPWRFIVVDGDDKNGMIHAMNTGLTREANSAKLPESAPYMASVKHTIGIMEEAPATIFIVNPLNRMEDFPTDWEARLYEVANIQSVGACIQNMLLAATDLGYGSLWICDIFFAYNEIAEWLGTSAQIVAAVSFGCPAEEPGARPRNALADTVTWKHSSR